MNIDAYNLDSLRTLVRKLEKENQNLKQKLNEVNLELAKKNNVRDFATYQLDVLNTAEQIKIIEDEKQLTKNVLK